MKSLKSNIKNTIYGLNIQIYWEDYSRLLKIYLDKLGFDFTSDLIHMWNSWIPIIMHNTLLHCSISIQVKYPSTENNYASFYGGGK